MNIVISALFLLSILYASFTGTMSEVSTSSLQSAKDAVTLAIGLIGVMSFWLGLMKVLERGGGVEFIGSLISPVLKKLFPEIPKGHPAFGAIVMNISTNVLGLGNAATPFGIKAMESLKTLSLNTGEATHAMCMFLAINTSGVAILPLGVIGVRSAAGCMDPVGIWIPSLIATCISTTAGILTCVICRQFSSDLVSEVGDYKMGVEMPELNKESTYWAGLFTKAGVWLLLGAFIFSIVSSLQRSESISVFFIDQFFKFWLLPALIFLIVLFGVYKRVPVYETAVEGAKEGFKLAVTIIPFLVMVLVAIGMCKASGMFYFLSYYVEPFSSLFGIPAEAVPMALLRPLSGTGAFALMGEIVISNPDSYQSFVSSVMMGSTETTFYVLAVYFGAVGITKVRYAVLAGIVADLSGLVASGLLSQWWWGLN